MKGVPIRIEIGPRDVEKGEFVLSRRDTLEKKIVKINDLKAYIEKTLLDIHNNLYSKARQNMEKLIYTATNFEELSKFSTEKKGFFKAMWCENPECEAKIKDEIGLTIRCIPFKQEEVSHTCICCGAKARKQVFFAKAY